MLGNEKKVRFIFMGDGTCRRGLEEKARDVGVDDIIIFTGFVDDVAPYCNIADLNLNCSWGTETASLALCEAMSLSLPSVVTDFGGNPYLITDGVNGSSRSEEGFRINGGRDSASDKRPRSS